MSNNNFSQSEKNEIEEDIEKDFQNGYQGIIKLPSTSRLGVYCAYKYYLNLFYKIKRLPPHSVIESRIRVSDKRKLYLLTTSAFQNKLGMI